MLLNINLWVFLEFCSWEYQEFLCLAQFLVLKSIFWTWVAAVEIFESRRYFGNNFAVSIVAVNLAL